MARLPEPLDVKPIIAAAFGLVLLQAVAASAQTPDNNAPPESPEAKAPVLPNLGELIAKSFAPPSPDGAPVRIPRVLRGEGTHAGGPANDLNTGGQIEDPTGPKGSLRGVMAGKELFHGNYCGKGQRGTGLPPTDALDAACMRHDACYEAARYASCACDGVLRAEASAVADDRGVAAEVRRRALSVLEAAGAMACRSP